MARSPSGAAVEIGWWPVQVLEIIKKARRADLGK